MQIELTNFCNLRCPICATGMGAMNRRPVAMDVGLFKQLIDEVGPYLLTVSLWGWGEPLLHPHLSQILGALRKHSIATFLSTNGQNLHDDSVIQALIGSPPMHLIVAIDGITDETNSQFRSGAKLDPILAGVQRLADIKKERSLPLPILHMRYIVMKHNQHEVPHLKNFAMEHGFDLLTIRTLSGIDAESSDAMIGSFIPDMHEFRAYAYNNGERIRRSDHICLEPFWFPSMLADGTIVACIQDYNAQQSFGVLAEGTSFTDLWFGKNALRVRKVIRDIPGTVSFCRNCPSGDRTDATASVQALFINPNIPRTVVTV